MRLLLTLTPNLTLSCLYFDFALRRESGENSESIYHIIKFPSITPGPIPSDLSVGMYAL